MRFHLKKMLSDLGVKRVQTAATMEEAQLVLMVEVVDVIVCDWYLNMASGLDLLREVRKKVENNRTAFLMVTAENTKEKVIEALKAGVDDYLVKPISTATMSAKISAALERRSK